MKNDHKSRGYIDSPKWRPARSLAILTLPMILSGCGVPLAISAIGYAADALSAGASGKTINDHFVSQIMNMDCGLMRFLNGDWICRQRGVDPDDDTLYLADGRTIEGPPRPWGTSAEPNFEYEDDVVYEARGWAEGAVIATDSAGDDPSGKMLAAIYEADDDGTEVARIGDLSKTRKREAAYRAVAERVRFAQALQLQYRQSARGPATATGQPGQTAAIPGAFSTYIIENLTFSASLGLDRGYASTSPTMVAALARLNSAPPATMIAAAPAAPPHRVASVPATSATALGLATYGPAAADTYRPAVAVVLPPRPRAPAPVVETAEVVVLETPAPKRDRIMRLAAAETYLVVGSFQARSNAITAAALRHDADVSVIESAVQGRAIYRLVAGPFKTAKVESARRDLRIAGYPHSWTISQCESVPAETTGCLTDTQTVALGKADDTPQATQLAGLN